jgi:hypothetical protein
MHAVVADVRHRGEACRFTGKRVSEIENGARDAG